MGVMFGERELKAQLQRREPADWQIAEHCAR